jgi:hypothetical protein
MARRKQYCHLPYNQPIVRYIRLGIVDYLGNFSLGSFIDSLMATDSDENPSAHIRTRQQKEILSIRGQIKHDTSLPHIGVHFEHSTVVTSSNSFCG